MADVVVTRVSGLSPGEAWRRVTCWERHAGFVPLTRIGAVDADRVGGRFTARTGLGVLGFDDPMEITVWRPPSGAEGGYCRLVKRGRVVTGWAEIAVRPHGGGSVVDWRERVRVTGVPGVFGPVVAAAGRRLFGRTVDGLLADDRP